MGRRYASQGLPLPRGRNQPVARLAVSSLRTSESEIRSEKEQGIRFSKSGTSSPRNPRVTSRVCQPQIGPHRLDFLRIGPGGLVENESQLQDRQGRRGSGGEWSAYVCMCPLVNSRPPSRFRSTTYIQGLGM